jgi:hypothetical protein
VLRPGGLNPNDAASLLGDAEIAPTYLGRRRSSPAERGTKVQLLAALCFSIRVRAITDQIRRCVLPRGPRPRVLTARPEAPGEAILPDFLIGARATVTAARC